MTKTFNYDPYNDDFDEDKNFMRVLYRPEYGVQARELTQSQTILANQIEKFANHIFENGSPVKGGRISLDTISKFLILESQYDGENIVASNFLNKIIVSYNSSKLARAKVIAIDGTTLVVKYLSGDRFVEGDELRVYGENIFAKLVSTNAVGTSYVAHINDGVFYFKGQFVKVTSQHLIVQLYYKLGYDTSTINVQPSCKIGIQFDEKIVDEIDDVSLLDPAQGSFNYQAPGAVRYAVDTALTKRNLDSPDTSSFFELLRLVNGVKTKEVNVPLYSEIEKTMARRTYDESGNYTVDPFVISLEEGSTEGYFDVVLDPGKAYVGGYEFETIAPTTISVQRGRETTSVSDYDLPTNYGSSVVLDTIKGAIDITTFPQLDIHNVPHTSVNTSTTAAYNSTKIGTIYVDMMRYNGSTSSANGNTHTFTVNTFGANTTPITGTLPGGSSTTVINLPTSFSTSPAANAYANMYFRITDSGGTSLSPRLITESNSILRTITIDTALPFIPGAANTFSIQTDFKSSRSLVSNTSLNITFAGNINSQSLDSSTGYATISNPTNSALIFNAPQDAIKENTISNMDFYVRKKYSATTSSTTGKFTVTATSPDTFSFSTGGVLSSSTVLDNIICFVKSGSNTRYGIVPNTVLSLANTTFVTVTPISTSSFEVDIKATETIVADLLVTTKINNAENGSTGVTKRKQLIPLTTGADLHAKVPYEMGGANTLAAANTSGFVTSFTGGSIYTSVGGTNFDTSTILTDLRTPGKAVSLQVPDVYKIVRITDSKSPTTNVTTAMLSSSAYDVTNNYEFDNGQRKSYYDHATITLKRGYPAPTGRVYVQYQYLKTTSVYSGLFTPDSYVQSGSNFTYGQIAKFDNKEDSTVLPLKSAFDFRPSKVIGGTTLSGALNPEPLEYINMNYDYYLSRKDQVVIKPTKKFNVVKGKSDISPLAPPVENDDMLIYTLTIPAYTDTVKEVRADFQNHRRYTMDDIQKFESRIRGLEYYVSLTSLEKDAASTKVLDGNGLERSKYGILVDNFITTENQAIDVGYDNRNLVENKSLKPASLMRFVKMIPKESSFSGSTNLMGTGTKKALLLSYTPTSFITQPYATKSTPITESLFAGFKGSTKLFPEFTGEVDTSVTAKVTLNSTQGVDNAFNFLNSALQYIADNNPTWTTDANSPFARVAGSQWYTTENKTEVSDTGWYDIGYNYLRRIVAVNDNTYLTTHTNLLQKTVSTSTSQVDVGSFITDLAIQPYMKPKQILFSSSGLRPDTIYYSFFDDTDVNKYIVVPNKVTLNANSELVVGESVLIANSLTDLAANVASLLAGGTSYNAGFIVVSETGSANVSIINETGMPVTPTTANCIYSLDSGKYYTISAVNELHSGVGTISSSTIQFGAEASSTNEYYTGNTINIVRSTSSFNGIGEQFTITAYTGSTKTATLSATPTTTGNVIYSMGTNKSNKQGDVGGAFYMPQATFLNGQRIFRVTESFNNSYDADAISYADKTYVASGITANKTKLVDTVLNVGFENTISGNSISTVLSGSRNIAYSTYHMKYDPLAQTFNIDEQIYPSGVFLSSVDIFFKAKDTGNIPVQLEIRPTVNGVPSSDYWYPESVVIKKPSEVNISESPALTDSTTATNFEFDFPVYLKPGLYSFSISTSSPEYILWNCEKGGTTVDNKYVDKQPYLGTMYRSQNSGEGYVPLINEDIMFNLNRCLFPVSSTATFVLQNERQSSTIKYDKLRLNEISVIPSDKDIILNHSITNTTIDGTKESSYRFISPSVNYTFSTDYLYTVGYRRKKLLNQNDLTLNIEMSTLNDAVSPIISLESLTFNLWENFVDNAEINAEDFTIISPGTGYSNANVIYIQSSTGSGATANLMCDVNGNVTGIYVSSTGSGYIDDFSISIGANSTNPEVAATGTGADIVLNSEYDSSGGPCLARYITKPIVLADGYDAGDIRVFLSANKPGVSEVTVFYKILSASDPTAFKDRPYIKMECINPSPTASLDEVTYTDYEYRPSSTQNYVNYVGTNGVTYDNFKTMSIKIVLTSSDPAIVPSVKDLRIIAVPAE